MKRTILAVAVSLLSLTLCEGQTERTFEKTLNVSGPVTLDLVTDAGGIRVTRGEPGVVRVRGILKAQRGWWVSGGGNAEDKIRQLERNPPIEQSGSTVRVGYVTDKSLLKGVSMRLEIVTPPESELRARTDSGGISVDGIKGPVDCKADSGGIEANNIDSDVHVGTDSGGIHIRAIRGSVYARADSGGIEAQDIAGAIDVATDSGGIHLSQTRPAPVRARADSGGARLTLARAGGYDLKLHSDSGRISTPEMTVHGKISQHNVEGSVRGGGPRVEIDVDSGNIDID